MARQETIIEIQRIGAIARVSAIDPESYLEVTIQAPARLSDDELSRVAIAKLNYRLKKTQVPPETGGKGGIVV